MAIEENIKFNYEFGKLKHLVKVLDGEYWELRQIENLKKMAVPSGYKEYPHKVYQDDGYSYLYKDDFSYLNCIGEHRYVVQQVLGKKILKNRIVHHLNGDKIDNRKCNLVICDRSYHGFIHKKIEKLQANWGGLTKPSISF